MGDPGLFLFQFLVVLGNNPGSTNLGGGGNHRKTERESVRRPFVTLSRPPTRLGAIGGRLVGGSFCPPPPAPQGDRFLTTSPASGPLTWRSGDRRLVSLSFSACHKKRSPTLSFCPPCPRIARCPFLWGASAGQGETRTR